MRPALRPPADYRPVIGRTYLGLRRARSRARILGAWMVLLRVCTQMLERTRIRNLKTVARRSADAIMQAHFNPSLDFFNELLNHDLSRPDNEYAQLRTRATASKCSGWCCTRRGVGHDQALFTLAADRYRRHIAVAWDDVFGGVFRNLQHVERNIWLTDKVLWAQEEVLIGTLLLVEAGVEWAAEEFGRMYRYVRSTYPLASRGRPL